jgi:hypothetical protein
MYQVDANNEHLLQVALENDRLVLYKLSDSFTRKVDHGTKQLIGKHHSQLDNATMYQQRTKIADLGTVELITTNDIQWVASMPRYEYLADMLNKSGKITASEYDKYAGLSLTHDQLSVGKRELCKKKSIGQSVTVTGNYDPIIIVSGKVKHVKTDDSCKWLSSFHSINVPSEWGLNHFECSGMYRNMLEVSIQLMSPASGDVQQSRVKLTRDKLFPFN